MRCAAVVLLLLASYSLLPAATVAFDIVYVRAPRPGGNTGESKLADVFRPMWLEPGSDLMVRRSDGRTERLFSAGAKGAVADPFVMFDGRRVVFSFCPDVTQAGDGSDGPAVGCDIWIADAATKAATQLTHGDAAPNTNPQLQHTTHPVFNMGPTPVSGQMIAFTSNRWGFVPPKGYTPVTSQLFVMNEDGSNVQAIAPMTIGAALHPFQLKDGRLAFSTHEDQGYRDQRLWSLWTIWPDGRHWEPMVSAFAEGEAYHFATQLSDGALSVEQYYNKFNFGAGTLFTLPISTPSPNGINFGPSDPALNPIRLYTDTCGRRLPLPGTPFTWVGTTTATPWATPFDEASGLRGGVADCTPEKNLTAPRLGKVQQPQGTPGNGMLLAYSPGPVNHQGRPVDTPFPDFGIYLAPDGHYIDHPDQLVKVVDDPNANEIWPRPLVPYRDIYGVDEPKVIPFLPNDGTANAALPAGTPYGIIGTSSLCKRESKTGNSANQNLARGGIHYDGLETLSNPGSDNWVFQGSDSRVYSCDDIDSVRLVMLEPRSEATLRASVQWANERMRVLGEVPVRKAGITDPDGNPDTSFWAKVPADTPITFQILDRNGQDLTMAQTWHQVRPGEVRVDCGGCHAHSQQPTDFAATAAAKLTPADLTLQPAHDVEYRRDIEPLIQSKCVSCHQGDPAAAPAKLAFTSDPLTNYKRLADDRTAQFGIAPPAGQVGWRMNTSRYVRPAMSPRSLLTWVLANKRLDGWTNDRFPGPPQSGVDAATWNRYMTDLDFVPGTVDHSRLVTDAQRRMVSTWIDLFAPYDAGCFFCDENRPTLTLKVANGTLLVGAADGYSGLDEGSLSVEVNGAAVSLSPRGGGIWSAPLPGAGSVTIAARVRDRAGNVNELTLRPRSIAAPSSLRSPNSPSVAVSPIAQLSDGPGVTSTTSDGIRFRTEPVLSALDGPQALAFAPDGRLFVAERSGAVQIVDLSRRTSSLALPPDPAAAGRTELFDLALDPDFTRSGMVYVYGKEMDRDDRTITSVVRYREAGGYLAQRALVLQGIPTSQDGGGLKFGPDGMLYVTTADTALSSQAQDLSSFAGKILRLTPDGTSPRDNPYASPVFVLGHRGPSALSWHPATGNLWMAMEGPNGETLLRRVVPGENEGWPGRPIDAQTLGGTSAAPAASTTRPAASFYRGQRFPQFVNDLFVTTAGGAQLMRVRVAQGQDTPTVAEFLRSNEGIIRDVTSAPDGLLYFILDSRDASAGARAGRILRVVPAG